MKNFDLFLAFYRPFQRKKYAEINIFLLKCLIDCDHNPIRWFSITPGQLPEKITHSNTHQTQRYLASVTGGINDRNDVKILLFC